MSVEIVDLLIFSASVGVSGCGSSMLTWMFHRFVSLSVVYNNHISIIVRPPPTLTSAMLSISLTMLSVSHWVLNRSVSCITLCRESQVKVAWWLVVSSFTSHRGLVSTLHSAGGIQSNIRAEIIIGLSSSQSSHSYFFLENISKFPTLLET